MVKKVKDDDDFKEETIELNPQTPYWKFGLALLIPILAFSIGYCLGNDCSLTTGNNFLGRLAGSITLASREAFSNIFNNSKLEEEKFVEIVDLNKQGHDRIPSPIKNTEGLEAKENEANKELPPSVTNKIEEKGIAEIGKTIKQGPTIKECNFDVSQNPSHDKVILNEIAWMGAKGYPRHEWVELKNISGSGVDISNWHLTDADEEIKVTFPPGSTIINGGFYLLERNEDAVPQIKADYLYTGNLENEGDGLELFAPDCSLVDKVLADPGWPAGLATPKYLTAERDSDLSWHDYNGKGLNGIWGTPRAENSEPVVKKPEPEQSQLGATTPSLSPSGSSSDGLTEWFPRQGGLSFAPPPTTSIDHLLISEIMAGIDGNADYEFIELYNPTENPIDLTGWSIKKKNSSGNESSLLVPSRLEGKVVLAKHYLLLTRDTGYTGTVTADVLWPASSSYALAYTNNSILIYKSDGSLLEAVSWTEIVKGQSYERESWSSNNFKPQPNPNPQNSQSI